MVNQTTTGTGSTSTSYIFNPACKYYLPCGKCDKTGEMCIYYYWRPANPGITPQYPWWMNQVTCDNNEKTGE